MSIALARRVSELKPSVTLALTNRAKALKQQGRDIVIMTAGEPDFDTPEPIKAAAKAALDAGATRYTPILGDLETRGVIADKLRRENGIPGLTPAHVAISAGGKHSLYVVLHGLLDPPRPGEEPQEVILPTPAWVSYRPIAELAGGRVVEVPTTPESDFRASAERIATAITPRSRVLILNSPSNPCGTQYTEADLRAIAAVVADKARSVAPGLVIVSDEIYEKIVYGGIPHFSIGSIPEVAERTITLNGLSKAFAMTGWRVGYAAIPGDFGLEFIRGMETLQGQMTSNITSFIYPAIRAAMTGPEVSAQVERMREAFAGRAELIHGLLGSIPGLVCPRPTGAFYVFPDVSRLFGRRTRGGRMVNSAMSYAEAALEEVGVALVPGEDFGGCGSRCVRLSFASSESVIREGASRLSRLIET